MHVDHVSHRTQIMQHLQCTSSLDSDFKAEQKQQRRAGHNDFVENGFQHADGFRQSERVIVVGCQFVHAETNQHQAQQNDNKNGCTQADVWTFNPVDLLLRLIGNFTEFSGHAGQTGIVEPLRDSVAQSLQRGESVFGAQLSVSHQSA